MRKPEVLEERQPPSVAKSNAICELHRQGHQSRVILGKALCTDLQKSLSNLKGHFVSVTAG